MTRSGDELELLPSVKRSGNGGGADTQFDCARFGPREKRRPLQGLLEFTQKKTRGATHVFEITGLESQQQKKIY